MRLIQKAKAQKIPLPDLLAQGALFGDDLSPEVKSLVGLFYQDPGLRRLASRPAITERLRTYAGEALKTSSGADLLGQAPLGAKDILEAMARNRAGEVGDAATAIAAAKPGAAKVRRPEVKATGTVARPERNTLARFQRRPAPAKGNALAAIFDAGLPSQNALYQLYKDRFGLELADKLGGGAAFVAPRAGAAAAQVAGRR